MHGYGHARGGDAGLRRQSPPACSDAGGFGTQPLTFEPLLEHVRRLFVLGGGAFVKASATEEAIVFVGYKLKCCDHFHTDGDLTIEDEEPCILKGGA